jgi:hypothetical protein
VFIATWTRCPPPRERSTDRRENHADTRDEATQSDAGHNDDRDNEQSEKNDRRTRHANGTGESSPGHDAEPSSGVTENVRRRVHAGSTSREIRHATHANHREQSAPTHAGLIKLNLAPDEGDTQSEKNHRESEATDAENVGEPARDLATNGTEGVNVRQGDEEPNDNQNDN